MAFVRLALEHISDVVIRFDGDWRCLFVSASCRDVFGYDPEELRASRASRLVHPDDRAGLRSKLSDTDPRRRAMEAMWRGVRRDGRILSIEARYFPAGDDSGCVVVLRDVTLRKLAEDRLIDARDRLERAASFDSLSGLPNRDAFIKATGPALDRDNELAVLFIDLDRFGAINEKSGHEAGDGLLRTVAARLKSELTGEPMVARLTADKFGVLLRVANGDQGIAARARDLIRIIDQPWRFAGAALTVGATIGISVCPRDGTDAATLIRHAEIATSRAKQGGGGTYRFYEPAMGLAMARAAQLKQELPAAIEDGQIVPWFQPMVRLEDMRLVGYEALARWRHPSLGVLEPAMFLPLAEEIGASAALFAALLGRACRMMRELPADMTLAVNISGHELRDESLPATVARVIADTGFDGTRLEIEITEHGLLLDPEVARGVLEGLRALGVSVALDDFGTGYSSLFHLRELPVDKVKIDGSFMRTLTTDAACDRFVGAIVALGHALGLELTAEGIEDEAALTRLRALGCTYGQGNFLGEAQHRMVADSPWR